MKDYDTQPTSHMDGMSEQAHNSQSILASPFTDNYIITF